MKLNVVWGFEFGAERTMSLEKASGILAANCYFVPQEQPCSKMQQMTQIEGNFRIPTDCICRKISYDRIGTVIATSVYIQWGYYSAA